MSAVAVSARLVLAVLFLLASFEKLRAAATGTARWHPAVLPRPRLRAHAPWLFVLSAALDAALAVALAAALPSAAAGAFIAVSAYSGSTAKGLRTYPDRENVSCRCFGALFDASRPAQLISRTSVLLVLSLVGTQYERVREFTAVSALLVGVEFGLIAASVLFGGRTRLALRRSVD